MIIVLVTELLAADAVYVAELVQQRTLLGKNQQQRKNKSEANSGSIHGLAATVS